MQGKGHFKKIVYFCVTAGMLITLEFFLFSYYLVLPVTINGKSVRVRKGSAVKEVLKEKGITLTAGDLYDAQGNLLGKKKGNPPVVKVNGRQVKLSQKVNEKDNILAHSGSNIYEKIVEKIVTIPAPFSVTGSGAWLTYAQRGKPGTKAISVGAKTGLVFGEREIESPTPCIIKRYNKSHPNSVVLTFDDGPHPRYTRQIMAILRGRDAPATFFIIGKHAEKYPQVLKEIIEAGYPVGNHSYSHSNLGQASYAQITEEIEKTEQIIRDQGGKPSRWIKPPGGGISPLLIDSAAGKGYKMIMWSVDPSDWKKVSPPQILNRVLENTRGGSVILLHDGGGDQSATVQALPAIIDHLRERGYNLVSLDELYETTRGS